jgi:hypothetical protein
MNHNSRLIQDNFSLDQAVGFNTEQKLITTFLLDY